jgi:hypothetical protein
MKLKYAAFVVATNSRKWFECRKHHNGLKKQ